MDAHNSTSLRLDGLPSVALRNVFSHLGSQGPAPILRTRSVSVVFLDESRTPLAQSVLSHLQRTQRNTVPDEERLQRVLETTLALKSPNYFPVTLREPILRELCRITSSLANEKFRQGWKAMVAQYNQESEAVRLALRPDMDETSARCQLYGGEGEAYTPSRPHW